jgi:hypothetical protein
VKNSIHPLVAVVWDDAKATAVVEYDLNEVRTQFHKAARYTTYGLLLVDDEKGITLASEEGDDQNLRGLTFIPRQMIVEVVILGRQRAKKARTKRQPAAPQPASPKPAPSQHASDDSPRLEPHVGSDDEV